jgi:DMSO/TMAO reductase YedYZ molybdopterin-dependent catalytic subunit
MHSQVEDTMLPITRRQFLIVASGSALATAIASCAPTAATTTPEASPASGSAAVTPDRIEPAPTAIVITPSDELYQQSYGDTPVVNVDDWRLTIDGLVDAPLQLDLNAIKSLPPRDEVRTLECIGNPVGGNLIGNVEWNGVRLQDVLAHTRIDPKATHAKFQAADNYFTCVALDWIMQAGTLLVHGLNGQPLSAGHGFPLRIMMPGLYGQKMPKWITHIEFTDKPILGYWEAQQWSNIASVQTNSQFTFPREGQTLPSGAVPVYGIAFAGKRRIVKVEVSFDEENWVEAKLLQDTSPLIWTQWVVDWPAAQAGTYHLQVRATDDAGFTQNTVDDGYLAAAFPDGTNLIQNIAVRVAQG